MGGPGGPASRPIHLSPRWRRPQARMSLVQAPAVRSPAIDAWIVVALAGASSQNLHAPSKRLAETRIAVRTDASSFAVGAVGRECCVHAALRREVPRTGGARSRESRLRDRPRPRSRWTSIEDDGERVGPRDVA